MLRCFAHSSSRDYLVIPTISFLTAKAIWQIFSSQNGISKRLIVSFLAIFSCQSKKMSPLVHFFIHPWQHQCCVFPHISNKCGTSQHHCNMATRECQRSIRNGEFCKVSEQWQNVVTTGPGAAAPVVTPLCLSSLVCLKEDYQHIQHTTTASTSLAWCGKWLIWQYATMIIAQHK